MDRTQLIRAVQVRIDDIVTDNAIQVISNDTIDQVLDEQLSNAFKAISVKYLPHKEITGSITAVQSGLYKINLPADYLRIVRFKTNILATPITDTSIVQEGSQDYNFMYQPYLSGGNTRVRAAVINDNGYKLLFNSTSSGTVTEGKYISVPIPEDVSMDIIDPVAWYIAGTVLLILGEQEQSKAAYMKYNEFLTQI